MIRILLEQCVRAMLTSLVDLNCCFHLLDIKKRGGRTRAQRLPMVEKQQNHVFDFLNIAQFNTTLLDRVPHHCTIYTSFYWGLCTIPAHTCRFFKNPMSRVSGIQHLHHQEDMYLEYGQTQADRVQHCLSLLISSIS